MRHRIVLVLSIIVLLASVSFAHGDKKHIMGKVEKIGADSLVVKQADGTPIEVKLASGTVYVSRDGKPSKLSDLAVGDRVVIHATPTGDTFSADEVKFSPPTAPAPSTTPKSRQ
jgi:hypothetical protein